MKNITLRELLEAGCHFGHRVDRWNPKAKEFIYGEKNGIHIINLEKTLSQLIIAVEFLRKAALSGKTIVFVATKKQAKPILMDLVEKHKLNFVVDRWPGGFLTNFDMVAKSFVKMRQLEELIQTASTTKSRTKKEILLAEKELKKLNRIYGGVRELKSIPDILVVVDTKKEEKIVREAERTGVEIVGLVDTNASPYDVAHYIPTNDDAAHAIACILTPLAEAVEEGRGEREKTINKE